MILVEKAQYNSGCFLFVKRIKITMQSHVKTFQFVCYCFYCLTSIYFLFFVLFCFCKTNFDVFTIFSELSGLEGNVLFMEIYIPMISAILSLTKKCNLYVKKKNKRIIF